MNEPAEVTELSHRSINCPLVWDFDRQGAWDATSMIMDPDMVDEPNDTWCKEWCLQWHIEVMEDGTFSAAKSDKLLLERKELKKSWKSLSALQASIELAEDTLRCDEEFLDGREIHYLSVTKYKA